jgi:hypothetical protein
MKRQEVARELIRRHQAASVLGRTVRRYLTHRRLAKQVQATIVIQKFWRGYRSRLLMKNTWQAILQQLKEIRERLTSANAAATPENR